MLPHAVVVFRMQPFNFHLLLTNASNLTCTYWSVFICIEDPVLCKTSCSFLRRILLQLELAVKNLHVTLSVTVVIDWKLILPKARNVKSKLES